jgi:hypothetical protein
MLAGWVLQGPYTRPTKNTIATSVGVMLLAWIMLDLCLYL